MFENWANDERVTRFLTWEPHQSPEITKQLLEDWCAAYENPSTYNWLIEFQGKAIGSISVVRLSEKCEYAELGYCIGYAFWNKGIMAGAAGAGINSFFASRSKPHRHLACRQESCIRQSRSEMRPDL